jgi:hypothetical protein
MLFLALCLILVLYVHMSKCGVRSSECLFCEVRGLAAFNITESRSRGTLCLTSTSTFIRKAQSVTINCVKYCSFMTDQVLTG